MNPARKISLSLLVLIIFLLAFSAMTSVWCQEDGKSLTIIIKDETTGNLAQGVMVQIKDMTGKSIKTFNVEGNEPITTTLPTGDYEVLVQIPLFGVSTSIGSEKFTLKDSTELEIKISAIFIPVQYVSWVAYSTTAVAGVTISFFLIRHFLKIKKITALIVAGQSAVIATGAVAVAVPLGINVAVKPDQNVLISFSKVTKAGTATARPITEYPPLPKGGEFIGTPWDIRTHAAFTGMTLVGIAFDGSKMTEEQKKKLKVYRTDLEQITPWKEVTAKIDTEKNIAYGTTDHFSVFGVR